MKKHPAVTYYRTLARWYREACDIKPEKASAYLEAARQCDNLADDLERRG